MEGSRGGRKHDKAVALPPWLPCCMPRCAGRKEGPCGHPPHRGLPASERLRSGAEHGD